MQGRRSGIFRKHDQYQFSSGSFRLCFPLPDLRIPIADTVIKRPLIFGSLPQLTDAPILDAISAMTISTKAILAYCPNLERGRQ
jgi:hypothetical protein